jgi:hypothetical protein
MKKSDLLAAASTSASPRLIESLAPTIPSHGLGGVELRRSCPYCFPRAEETLIELGQWWLACTGWQIRLHRISLFCRSFNNCQLKHRADVIEDLRWLHNLRHQISRTATSILDANLPITDISWGAMISGLALFLRSRLEELLSSDLKFNVLPRWDQDEGERDCLGRLHAHQLMDNPEDEVWLEYLITIEEKTKDNINDQDALGRTLLHIACQKGCGLGIRLLLEYGADPGATTMYGSLPLHYAAANGDKDICALLLAHRGRYDVNQVDAMGYSPYVLASDDVKDLIKKYRNEG